MTTFFLWVAATVARLNYQALCASRPSHHWCSGKIARCDECYDWDGRVNEVETLMETAIAAYVLSLSNDNTQEN